MRLTDPTDFDILDAFGDGNRNNAANLAYILDRDRGYINTRLPHLADHGLLERVGPAPSSGLYVITEKGRVVAENRDAYRSGDADFEALIERKLEPSGRSRMPLAQD